MKFISSSDIQSVFKKLMNEYEKYSWTVAWAGADFDSTEVLYNNSSKIKRMIVGIHFYQTHPDFMKKFYINKNVRFIMKPSGIFHPKLYLFENNNTDWTVIIGSHNFTGSAFNLNTEASVLITSKDEGSVELKKDIDEYVNTIWTQAIKLNEQDVLEYKEVYEKQKPSLDLISNRSKVSSISGKLSLEIQKMEWDEYYAQISRNELKERTKLLNHVNVFFRQYCKFKEMPEEARKGVAGLLKHDIVKEGFDWLSFGHMGGSGYFKQAIKENNEYISKALDEIPMDGAVNETHYKKFLKLYRKAIPEQNNPFATATRLLAMKRPDYFVCFNSANRDKLTEAFDLKKSVTMDQYWDQIIMKIQESIWWNDESPKIGMELSSYSYRTAFLDNLYFDYFQK